MELSYLWPFPVDRVSLWIWFDFSKAIRPDCRKIFNHMHYQLIVYRHRMTEDFRSHVLILSAWGEWNHNSLTMVQRGLLIKFASCINERKWISHWYPFLYNSSIIYHIYLSAKIFFSMWVGRWSGKLHFPCIGDGRDDHHMPNDPCF